MRAGIFDIQRASFVDGPGIRTVVFFKGCGLRCAWCHNPESHSFAPELLFYRERCVKCGACAAACKLAKDDGLPDGRAVGCVACGKCAEVCPTGARKLYGREMDTADIMKPILRDKAYYQSSGGGATFSGGECLAQPEPLRELLESCRAGGIHTAVDTAGNVDTGLIQEFSALADLFLYDVKHMDDAQHRKGTSVGNGLILQNLAFLLDRCPDRVMIRVPVIPGYNDGDENAAALRDFLRAHGKPRAVELLPYHRLGESKYAALGRETVRYDLPDAERVGRLKAIIG